MRFWLSGCEMGCRAIACLSTLGVGRNACGKVVRKLLLLRAVGMLALWLYLLVAKLKCRPETPNQRTVLLVYPYYGQ